MNSYKRKSIGIDIGGTFTDIVVIDPQTRTIGIGKTLTTPEDPAIGSMKALSSVMIQGDLHLQDVETVVHGTTLVPNTIIERKGAKTALITTMGHRDILEIGNELRYDLYDLFIMRPEPVVPRFLRKGVRERVGADGRVLVSLDQAQVKSIADELSNEGIDVIAICLMHSYANPIHEIKARDIVQKHFPEFEVVLSSEVAPEIREYERTSTTVLNGYVQPIIKKYLKSLENQLRDNGLNGSLYIMLSSGGTTTVETAEKFPIRLIESGPAAGALAAAYYSKLIGCNDLISFDMGGTTAKICLIEGGVPPLSTNFEVARVHRFKKGSGLPVKVPVTNMIEIGAGGGSIASIDNVGLLKVGPVSAGASPGPACYGFGGDTPTVTDADLILGYLNPHYFLGGEITLDVEAATRAIEKHVAKPLKTDVVKAAAGIFEVVSENMASAARNHISERCRDPRRYSLIAFGGAGPVHVYRVAQLLRIKKIICPFAAGTTSAFGLLVSPIAFDFVRSYVGKLDQLDWRKVEEILNDMEDRGRKMMLSAGVLPEAMTVTRSSEMRYLGQGHEIHVPMPSGGLVEDGFKEKVKNLFYESYRKHYGQFLTDIAIEAINWRVVVTAPTPDVDTQAFNGLIQAQGISGSADAIKGSRPVYFNEYHGFHETCVYDRYRLTAGTNIAGPAVIEEKESTVVVGPEAQIIVDKHLNLIIDL